MNEWINLREERDFGEKINATFLFARQNIKNLGLVLLLLGSPLMIASIILTSYFQLNLNFNAGTFKSFEDLPDNFFSLVAVLVLTNIVAYSWLMTITLSYITEYLNGNREISPAQVFNRASKKILLIIVASILTGIIVMFGMVLVVIPGIYLAFALAFVSAILIFEEISISKSISRSISLIGGKWWSTFGLILVMTIVAGLMQIVFTIPTYIIAIPKALHGNLMVFDAGTMIAEAIGAIGTTLLYPLIFIAIAFQYFNLVERKENQGLKQQIMMAGMKTETTPKNEGDY